MLANYDFAQLPREPEVEATNGKRVRIFTTREELPFAGHPTLGTALYLYSTTDTAPLEIVLDLNVGKIPVRLCRPLTDEESSMSKRFQMVGFRARPKEKSPFEIFRFGY